MKLNSVRSSSIAQAVAGAKIAAMTLAALKPKVEESYTPADEIYGLFMDAASNCGFALRSCMELASAAENEIVERAPDKYWKFSETGELIPISEKEYLELTPPEQEVFLCN